MEKTIGTLKEGALFGGGAILAAKFLQPSSLFSSQIAANPAFVNNMLYQHWGGVVAVGAAYASTKIDNPYMKALAIGVSIWGILTEARQDFGWDNTQIPPVAQWGLMGPAMAKNPNTAALDERIRALAQSARGPQAAIANVWKPITQGFNGVGAPRVRVTRAYTGVGRGNR